jgi:predicted DNA repair protein MutK
MEGVAMSIGLLGLLDDIAAIAKVAAASLDDVAAQATKAGAKAASGEFDQKSAALDRLYARLVRLALTPAQREDTP